MALHYLVPWPSVQHPYCKMGKTPTKNPGFNKLPFFGGSNNANLWYSWWISLKCIVWVGNIMNPVTQPHSRYINGRSVDSLHDNIEFQDPKLSRGCKDLRNICFKEGSKIIQFFFHISSKLLGRQVAVRKVLKVHSFYCSSSAFCCETPWRRPPATAMKPLGWEKKTWWRGRGVLFQANLTQVGKSPSISKWFFLFEGLSGLLGWSFIRSVTGVEWADDSSWKSHIPPSASWSNLDEYPTLLGSSENHRLKSADDWRVYVRSQESFSESLLGQVLWDYILELYSIDLYTRVTWCVWSCIIFRSGFNNISGLSWERCWNKCRRSGCTGFDGRRLGE